MYLNTLAGKPLRHALHVNRKYYKSEAFPASFKLAAIAFHVGVLSVFCLVVFPLFPRISKIKWYNKRIDLLKHYDSLSNILTNFETYTLQTSDELVLDPALVNESSFPGLLIHW